MLISRFRRRGLLIVLGPLAFAANGCGESPVAEDSDGISAAAAVSSDVCVAFELADRDASALAPAVEAAHAACPRNAGSWCSVDAATSFTFPWCTAEAPTLDAVAAAAVARTDPRGAFDVRYGSRMDRASLLATKVFGGGLLAAIDGFAGDVAVEAKAFESEESCQNCHQFRQKYVLFYPATRVVVVIDGGNGYDS